MIRLRAHAKVIFFLEITGKRPDGYHTLSTLFQTISLADELTFRPAADLTLTCSDPTLPTDSRNLVMKAALALREVLEESRGAKIHLEKRVPMGAGLGGGSSDAAATLLGLLQLWGHHLKAPKLQKLAVSLGADVPFFLHGGLCVGGGIGDELTPLKALPKTWMVLVYPGFGVSTKEAYAKVKLPFDTSIALPKLTSQQSTLGTFLFNRFESLIFPDHPELPRLKEELVAAGATSALMSGSGSSVFGLAASHAQGAKIYNHIKKNYPRSWLVHTV